MIVTFRIEWQLQATQRIFPISIYEKSEMFSNGFVK